MGENVIASLRSLLHGAIEQLELSKSVDMPGLTDDESEEDNAVPFKKSTHQSSSKEDDLFSPMRLRGSGDPMTQEELEDFDKEEIVEYLTSLGSHTDLTRSLDRLRKVLLAEQISSHISQLSDHTVAGVLKHFDKAVSGKKKAK